MTDDNIVKLETTNAKAINPLLTKLNKMPGSTIRLPSRGLFYTTDELDPECVDGELNIYQMTATDELIMRSTDMIFQGTAIESVIKRCLPQVQRPLDLLVADIDYILTQLRKISYGTHIPIIYECECAEERKAKAAKNKKIIIEDNDDEYLIPVNHFIQNTKELDAKDFNSTFKVVMGTGQEVTLQPLRFSDFIKIQQMQNSDSMGEIEHIKNFVSENFAAVTKAVDGVEDKEFIKEWYSVLPRLEFEKIRRKLDDVGQWGIDFKYEIECKHCKKKKELTTQLNPIYFFTLPSSPETHIK